MEVIKPPNDWHAGTEIIKFREMLKEKALEYPQKQFTLDLSDVEYMDSFSFRVAFDFLSIFSIVIPPRNQHIINMYNIWVDSKKGLSKGIR